MKKLFRKIPPGFILWIGVMIIALNGDWIYAKRFESRPWIYWALAAVGWIIMLGSLSMARERGRRYTLEGSWHYSRIMGSHTQSWAWFLAACKENKKIIYWTPQGKVLSPALREEELQRILGIVANEKHTWERGLQEEMAADRTMNAYDLHSRVVAARRIEDRIRNYITLRK